MTGSTRKEHTMKRMAITLAVVGTALGVVPAVANGARTQVVRPSVVKPSVAHQYVVRPDVAHQYVVRPDVAHQYVVRVDVARTAIERDVWIGKSVQIARVLGL